MKSLKGYAFIIGATIFWGASATFARFLFTQHVDTLVLVQTRMTLSCIALAAFFLVKRPSVLRIEPRDIYRFALLGIIGGAGSNYTYYFTIKETTVATAILLQYLAPLLVLLYAALTKEELLFPAKIFAGIISLAGCFLAIAGKGFSIPSIGRLGLLTGLGSAFCWAFANIMMRRLLNRYSVWTTLIYSFLFASLFWVFINPPWLLMTANYSSDLWKTFFIMALVSVLVPHTLYYSGIQYLTASQAIITATFEPVVAILSAFIILGESLTVAQSFGALLVIGAIILLQTNHNKQQVLQHE